MIMLSKCKVLVKHVNNSTNPLLLISKYSLYVIVTKLPINIKDLADEPAEAPVSKSKPATPKPSECKTPTTPIESMLVGLLFNRSI